MYWPDCVSTAAFLINRKPSPLHNNKTPYELLLRKLPNYKMLRVFGCLCYVSTLLNDRHKFSPRARASVFIGYPSGYKGYKVLDLETHSISISRNVVFHEKVFPFHDSNSSMFDFFSHIALPAFVPFVHVSSERVIASHPPSASHHPSTSLPPSAFHLPSPSYPPSASHHPSNVVPVVYETVTTETAMVPCHAERPRRQTKTPLYLSDYHCAILLSHSSHLPSHHTTPYPLSSVLTYKRVSPSFYQFLLSFSVETKPKTFYGAMTFERWRGAANDKLNAMD